jgi:hypothetical protein
VKFLQTIVKKLDTLEVAWEALLCFKQESDMFVLHSQKVVGNGLQGVRGVSGLGVKNEFLERGSLILC